MVDMFLHTLLNRSVSKLNTVGELLVSLKSADFEGGFLYYV